MARRSGPEKIRYGTIQLHQSLAASTWWCGPRRSSYERWAEMARQLFRGVRPIGHPQSSDSTFGFPLVAHLCHWIRPFTMISSAWFRTSSKLTGKKSKINQKVENGQLLSEWWFIQSITPPTLSRDRRKEKHGSKQTNMTVILVDLWT